ncbi:MAG: DUF669 domain-containing protein [Oscillospiraceae bacterium]|nr:DUF669 domain-containing protein [Oscillospiraceae bacterium]
MAFGTNYEGIPQGGGIVPEGPYETIITNAEIKQTQNGKYKVGFMLTIRNDIQQPCANRVLFMDIWRKKAPTPADDQVDGFNFAQLMAVSRAAQIPSGQSFESLEQFLQALCGRCLIAAVEHSEYNGKVSARVDPLGLAPTQFPECRHVMKQKTQSPAYGSAAPAPRQNQGYAQRPPQGYAAPPQHRPPQAAPPAPAPANLNPNDFEEILAGDEVPF